MPEDLAGVMRTAMQDLHPNVGELTAGGIERGVRKRRTRRISQISGATLGVAAVFGAVAMIVPGHGGDGGSGTSVSAGSAALSHSSSDDGALAAPTSPAAGAPGDPSSPGTPTTPTTPAAPPVSGDDMVTWLEQTLQPYHFSDEKVLYKAGTGDAGGPFATLRVSYPAGVGSVSLVVNREPWQDPNGSLPPYFSVQNLPDGSHLEIFNGPEWPAGNGDPTSKRIEVSWYRTDGIMVDFQVLNQAQEKGGTTASALPLTVDQTTKVVQSPVWNKAIASVPPSPALHVPSAGKGSDSQQKAGHPASSSGKN
ncbi:hypothetical protein KGQ19_06870 [Catenulispora sp. NL8]|uniref:Uncharacterized protein n=1 Tax=Catenulispora pinistramenti TaxID=2705254 RepID=A0ABS5KKM4_9ACTN|nr:hypothetical protein [Catenulispora pinistramenti]MBS2546585.1 hypothetical protein [Catenulispora pinistramenti]